MGWRTGRGVGGAKFDVHCTVGHLVFEMSCGYELTQLRPGRAEYDTVTDSAVKKILDFIFTDDFANSIEEVHKNNGDRGREREKVGGGKRGK